VHMPWGKHQGVDLADIETSYLVWVLEKCDNVRSSLRAAIEEELANRFGRSRRRSEPPPPPPPPPRRPCPDPTLAEEIVAMGFRALAKRHHPDVGGNTATMQRLSATADWLKARLT